MSFKRKYMRQLSDDPKTPAPKRDQRKGSAKNQPGSASSTRGGIKISASAEKALEGLRDEHNKRYTGKGRRVDIGMLRAVYRRGAGAFSTSHRPSVTSRNQWAMGRVKAFLRLVGKGQRKKAYTTDDDLLPSGHPNKSTKKVEQLAERYSHIDFSPPAGVREAAARALEVRASKPTSQRGMTPVGLARARDLSNGKKVSPETARRMLAYFSRHEVDKKGSSWDEQGKGWQAWHGWGGDAGFSWVRELVRQMEAADKEQLNERVRAFSEATPIDLDGLTVVIEDGQQIGRPFVTLAAGKVSSRMSGELITEVTPEHLAELKRVFDSRAGNDPVIIDWNHQSSPNAGMNTPETGGALGEVVALRLSDDGRQLIAVPAYNTRGLEVVEAAGGTLWSSPEFILGEVFARESGERTGGAQLLAITLTPRPQQAASSVGRVTLSEDSNMDLENLEGLETEQLIKMLRQKDALVKELEGRLKSQAMAEDDEEKKLAEEDEKKKLAEEDEEKKKMGEYRNLTERLTADNSQQAATIAQLSEQVARLEESERNARMNAEIDQLTHSGRISPNERAYAENFWSLREKGEGLAWEMLTRRGPNQAVNLSEVGHGASGEQLNRDSLTERVKDLAKAEKIQFTEAWGRLQREEPQLFTAVFGG